MFTDLLKPLLGPVVKRRQVGFEQRKPTLSARVFHIAAEIVSSVHPLQHSIHVHRLSLGLSVVSIDFYPSKRNDIGACRGPACPLSRADFGENSLSQHGSRKHSRGLSTPSRSLRFLVVAQDDGV
jgi:hypothetical protein